MQAAKTMFQKVWDLHLITEREDGEALLYVDYNLVHEGPFYAFDSLFRNGRKVRRPSQTVAFSDHYVPTKGRGYDVLTIRDAEIRTMIEQLDKNAGHAGILHFGMNHPKQGIMHVVAPELGMARPGLVITGSDSHTATNGAFGAFAVGVGASQIEHIMATQTVWLRKPKVTRILVDGELGAGVSAKDLILAIIERIGTGGGVGHVLEYDGNAVRHLSMEGRMTLCNMSIEAGARGGMVAPDGKTYAYIESREFAPHGAAWSEAMGLWQTLPSDDGAVFDREVQMNGAAIEPMVTWGTSQDEVGGISGRIPDPMSFSDPLRRRHAQHALSYMGLAPGTRLTDIKIDRVFIGSCTNARLDDIRVAASVAKGRKAAIPAIVVPGSMSVKRAAEAEGLHVILLNAGFEWRDSGCSMCAGSNGDWVPSGERCASTSNRNVEGRQGVGSRTHLMSPGMAASAAIAGRIADVRKFL